MHMSIKVLIKIIFVIWAMTVTVLSIISYPGGNDLLMSVKLTKSGFVMHIMAYFMGMLLCYYAYGKKDAGFKIQDTKCRKNIFIILLAGLLIFLYSILLEVVQFYLPYRTFNIYDVVGNGVGVLLFVAFVGVGGTVLRKDFSFRSK